MPENSVDVVISGAGPNGLMLAGELALAGVRAIVLDALPAPSAEPKANGLVGQVVRLLDMRGLYHEFGGAPGAPQPLPAYFFSGLPLTFDGLADNPMFAFGIPQPKLVRSLEKWVVGLGVDVRWGHEVAGLTQHDGGVEVAVAGSENYRLDARYLVGADGGKSFVRKAVGIEFPGHTATDSISRMGHVWLPDELRTGDGGLDIPGFGRVPFGHNRLERGGFVFAELEPGRPLVASMEFGVEAVPEGTPMTFEELRAGVRRVLGVDLPMEPPRGPGPHALRRIDNQNTRQAERYSQGNVFLLGDAAHVHSGMGGPGLNLGLQDAANLGWKLAAAVKGWAPAGLLDTYHTERHPVGVRVMMSSLAQTALFTPGPEVTAVRTMLTEMLRAPENTAYIAALMSGADTHYETDDPHPLSGRFVPHLTLETSDGTQRVEELLRKARPVLLTLTDDPTYPDIASDWQDRVDTITATSPAASAAALLLRPDGYVAWASDTVDATNSDRLRAALTRWFGTPPN
ncbi:2-polyprenyl-6-methoxyphenol hydroxylase-like FAD-dependent oxidoreductase [Nocardia tenerifensis]|uniref:2-polyprenyl-6-methoxyphenol hydroxylase-like FAD-dependent oxidoreductase n=1 Tax=Nocardia tenerifensis TaxID=228006 RepID=A0A318JUH7_9NOCA|nr:FAD-dependent monooxygenase [Nocardia tenerifensis]PXX56609.1 2-polyprenyl-6-methoxyphenol hydroxylase-like FAD-dependent oxidoreductase [Nocardia tenerifensis]